MYNYIYITLGFLILSTNAHLITPATQTITRLVPRATGSAFEVTVDGTTYTASAVTSIGPRYPNAPFPGLVTAYNNAYTTVTNNPNDFATVASWYKSADGLEQLYAIIFERVDGENFGAGPNALYSSVLSKGANNYYGLQGAPGEVEYNILKDTTTVIELGIEYSTKTKE